MAGNANSGQRKDKIIRDALMLAAKRVHEGDPQGRMKLAVAAEKVVEDAVNGDLAAFKEMADRIDGKAIQQTEGTVDVQINFADAREKLLKKVQTIVERGTAPSSGDAVH